jgi:hypothetical protein
MFRSLVHWQRAALMIERTLVRSQSVGKSALHCIGLKMLKNKQIERERRLQKSCKRPYYHHHLRIKNHLLLMSLNN